MNLCTATQKECANEKCRDRARLSVMIELDHKKVDINKIDYVDLTSTCKKIK